MSMFDIRKRDAGGAQEDESSADAQAAAGAAPPAGIASAADPGPAPGERDAPKASPKPSPYPGGSDVRQRDATLVGASMHIDGTLKGQEDVVVEGRVTGTVQLQDNRLTIGKNGKVQADLYANVIIVDGGVEGNLYAAEQVNVRASAKITGNITAPRVSVEDGAHLKGSIEMDVESVKAAIGKVSAGSKGGGQRASQSGDDDSPKSNAPSQAQATAAAAAKSSSAGSAKQGQQAAQAQGQATKAESGGTPSGAKS